MYQLRSTLFKNFQDDDDDDDDDVLGFDTV
jgi:hypothetical protein